MCIRDRDDIGDNETKRQPHADANDRDAQKLDDGPDKAEDVYKRQAF